MTFSAVQVDVEDRTVDQFVSQRIPCVPDAAERPDYLGADVQLDQVPHPGTAIGASVLDEDSSRSPSARLGLV